MEYLSRNNIYSRVFASELLLSWKTAHTGALFATAHMKLFKNDIMPQPDQAGTDFVEADFSGYGSDVIFLSTPVNFNDSAQALLASMTKVGIAADPFVPNNLYGWYIAEPDDSKWYAAERFTTPMAINQPDDWLQVYLALTSPFFTQAFG